MQIFQNHTTAKDENLYMCYKNIILGKKNSIASSHNSNLPVSRSYGWYNAMLSENLLIKPEGPCPERATGLPLKLH